MSLYDIFFCCTKQVYTIFWLAERYISSKLTELDRKSTRCQDVIVPTVGFQRGFPGQLCLLKVKHQLRFACLMRKAKVPNIFSRMVVFHWWLAMVQSVKRITLNKSRGELSLAVILHHLWSTSKLLGWYEPAREVAKVLKNWYSTVVANQPWKILQSTGKSSSETIEHLWTSTPKYIISEGEWYAWIMKISLETTHWFLLKPSFLSKIPGKDLRTKNTSNI